VESTGRTTHLAALSAIATKSTTGTDDERDSAVLSASCVWPWGPFFAPSHFGWPRTRWPDRTCCSRRRTAVLCASSRPQAAKRASFAVRTCEVWGHPPPSARPDDHSDAWWDFRRSASHQICWLHSGCTVGGIIFSRMVPHESPFCRRSAAAVLPDGQQTGAGARQISRSTHVWPLSVVLVRWHRALRSSVLEAD